MAQATPSKLGGGVEVDSHGKKAGKGPLVQTELSGTLGVSQDQTLITGCMNGWDVQSKHIYCLQGNGIDRADTAGCNGKGWRQDESYTLNTIDRPAVAFSFDSMASNSMKSSNPNSGCRETEVSKTVDCADPNPAKNQGGWQ